MGAYTSAPLGVDHTRKLAERLYREMPGAPRVPFDPERGVYLWGECDENEHFGFCWAIAKAIAEANP